VKDLKKDLKRAERGDVGVQEVRSQEWEEDGKRAGEEGVQNWINSRSGIQIASVSAPRFVKLFPVTFAHRQTTVQPWLDSGHRRYWLARSHGKVRT
jgi:hypothetical protein